MKILEKFKNKFKRRKWKVPDLVGMDPKNNDEASEGENLVSGKNKKNEINKLNFKIFGKKKLGKNKNAKKIFLTFDERMTSTKKVKLKKMNLVKGPKKIIGPMGVTYVKGDNNVKKDEATNWEKEVSKKISNLNNYNFSKLSNENEKTFSLSQVYHIPEPSDEEEEVVVSSLSKWNPNSKGVIIGKTIHYDIETGKEKIEKEMESILERLQQKEKRAFSKKFNIDDKEDYIDTFVANEVDNNFLYEEIDDEYAEDIDDEYDDEDEEEIDDEYEDENEEEIDDEDEEDIDDEYDDEDEEEIEDDYTYTEEIEEEAVSVIPIDNSKDYDDEEKSSHKKELFLDYELPPFELLDELLPNTYYEDRKKEADEFTRNIEEVIAIMNLPIFVDSREIGSRIVKFQCPVDATAYNFKQNDDFMKRVKAMIGNDNIRFQFPLYGKSNTFGIEVPFIKSQSVLVQMRTVMEQLEKSVDSDKINIFPLGLDVNGGYPYGDLTELVHLLVAGYTGSGKSVFLQAIIVCFLLRANPADLKLVLIDPKQVEFSKYESIPHLLTPIITNPKTSIIALEKMVIEMEERYNFFRDHKVKDILSYNKTVSKEEKMPFIVIIIDELADLMMSSVDNRIEQAIARLAQKARAAGIHMIVSTQRPSAEVITGLIKSNLPTRVAFALATAIDSRIILDDMGAELLLGKGDMIFKPSGQNKSERLQGVYTSEREVEKIVAWVTSQATPDFDEDFLNLEEVETKAFADLGAYEIKENISKEHVLAIKFIVDNFDKRKKISISGLQRILGIGHSKAARIVDALTAKGMLTEDVGNNKPRDVIGSIAQFEEIAEEWKKKI